MNKKLFTLIKDSEFISFDIFDTLILRKVASPTDVFLLVSKIYEKRYNKLNFDFKLERIHAENVAREKNIDNFKVSEITLKDIYKNLELRGINKYTCDILRKLEIEAEIKLATKNDYLYSIYKYCLKKNKKIILTSDMYLPLSVIKTILATNKYFKYKMIYLSSNLNRTKYEGSLYEYIIKDLNTKPSNILHIGDNKNSDINMAKKYGLKTYFYKKCKMFKVESYILKSMYNFKKNVENDDILSISLYNGLINNKFYSYESPQSNGFWYDFGYKRVGLLYYSFIYWLIKKSKDDKIDQLYFLARDGYIMNKVYDILTNNNKNRINSKYLYASRRAFNIPAISKLDKDSLEFLLSYSNNFTVSQVLQRVGLNPIKYRNAIKLAGFDNKNSILINKEDNLKLITLFKLLHNEVEDVSKQELYFLLKYLKQEGMSKYNRIGIVDLGWHGTLQKSLNKILKNFYKDIKLYGYYFGTFEKAKIVNRFSDLEIDSYLCNYSKPINLFNIIKLSVEIFELIFSAPHGSVIKFKNFKGKIVPIKDKNSLISTKKKSIQTLQQGAIDFILDFTNISNYVAIDIAREIAIIPLQKFLSSPTFFEAIAFGEFEHASGFGSTNIKRYIAKPPNIIETLTSPLNLLYFYRQSYWRAGYLKRIFRYVNYDLLFFFKKLPIIKILN